MRVLVTTAIAVLAMMMSRSCVAYPNQDAAAATEPPLPQSERELQLELEDNDDFDLINLAATDQSPTLPSIPETGLEALVNQDEDESDDQLTNVDAEDSSTFEPDYFVSKCNGNTKLRTCNSAVRFTAMAKTYNLKVQVKILYDKSKNRMRFQVILNRKCIGKEYLSGAEDHSQRTCKPYIHRGVRFDACIVASVKYSDISKGRLRVCSVVKIRASNKTWATAKLGCVFFK